MSMRSKAPTTSLGKAGGDKKKEPASTRDADGGGKVEHARQPLHGTKRPMSQLGEQSEDTPPHSDRIEKDAATTSQLRSSDRAIMSKKQKSKDLPLRATVLSQAPEVVTDYDAEQLGKMGISSLGAAHLQRLLQTAEAHLDSASEASREADYAQNAYTTSVTKTNDDIHDNIVDVHARLTAQMEGKLAAFKSLMDKLVETAAEGDGIQAMLLESAEYQKICDHAQEMQRHFEASQKRVDVIKLAIQKLPTSDCHAVGAARGNEESSQAMGASDQEQRKQKRGQSWWRSLFGSGKSQAPQTSLMPSVAPASSEVQGHSHHHQA